MVKEYLLSPTTGVTFRFRSGISGKPILQTDGEFHSTLFHEKKSKVLPDTITGWWRNVDLNEREEWRLIDCRSIVSSLTVIIPLKLVSSTLAPISAWESFSITPATGLRPAIRWKCLFAATLLSKFPSFREATLKHSSTRMSFTTVDRDQPTFQGFQVLWPRVFVVEQDLHRRYVRRPCVHSVRSDVERTTVDHIQDHISVNVLEPIWF